MNDTICPHCGLDTQEPALDQIVRLLQSDVRRDIYEIGDAHGKPSGKFTISYTGGRHAPSFDRKVAEAVAATGIVTEDKSCPGWFRRTA